VSDPSGPSESDSYLAVLDDRGDLSGPTVQGQHSIQIYPISSDIEVFKFDIMAAIFFPGRGCIGSTSFSKNQYFFYHRDMITPHPGTAKPGTLKEAFPDHRAKK